MFLSFKISLVIIIGLFGGNGNIYANTMVVTSATDEWVYCIDFSGNEWAFENSAGDWLEGDIASVILYDNCTDYVSDDRILTAKYSGWINGGWGYDKDFGSYVITFECD